MYFRLEQAQDKTAVIEDVVRQQEWQRHALQVEHSERR